MTDPLTFGTAQVLSDEQCRLLLDRARVARLGFTHRALPVVLPVNVVVLDDDLILRTESSSLLAAAIAGDVACVGVDNFDRIDEAAWTVMATGRLAEVHDPARLAEVAALAPEPWRPMARPHHVALRMEMLSGRGLGPFDLA